MNDYYNGPQGITPFARARAEDVNLNFQAIAEAFDKVPTMISPPIAPAVITSFEALSNQPIPEDVIKVITSEYASGSGIGGAQYLSDDLAADPAFRAAHPLATKVSQNGQPFRLLPDTNGNVEGTTMGCTPDGVGWNLPRAQRTMTTENGAILSAVARYAKAIGAGMSLAPFVGDDHFYGQMQPWVGRPGVSINFDPNARCANLLDPSIDNYKSAMCLLGNLHPAFIQRKAFSELPNKDREYANQYPVKFFTEGDDEFELETLADRYDGLRDRFAPGTQIAMVSDHKASADTFERPTFMILATVLTVNGPFIRVDVALNIPTNLTTCKVISLPENNWRGASWFPENNLFFYSGNVVNINGKAWSLFASDSAMNGAVIDGIAGDYGLILCNGNSLQNVVMRNCNTRFQNGADIALCAYKVTIEDTCIFDYKKLEGPEGIYANAANNFGAECGREVKVYAKFNMSGAVTDGGAPFRIQSGQSITVDIAVSAPTPFANAPLFLVGAGNSDAVFAMQDINVRIRGVVASVQRALIIERQGSAYMRRVGVDLKSLEIGIVGQPDAVIIDVGKFANTDDPQISVTNMRLPTGGVVSLSAGRISLTDSYIPDGEFNFAASDNVMISDRFSDAKRFANGSPIANFSAVGTGAEVVVFEIPIGRPIQGDVITASIIATQSTAVAADRSFRWGLWDTVANVAKPQIGGGVATYNQAAASTAALGLDIELTCAGDGFFFVRMGITDGAAAVPSRLGETYDGSVNPLSLRLYATQPNTMTTRVTRKSIRIANPKRSYGL